MTVPVPVPVRKPRGRPFQPGNPGRPLGSKNRVTQTLERLAVEQDFLKSDDMLKYRRGCNVAFRGADWRGERSRFGKFAAAIDHNAKRAHTLSPDASVRLGEDVGDAQKSSQATRQLCGGLCPSA